MEKAKIRLFVDQPLGEGQAVALGADAASYLFNVMRLGKGAHVALFNGRDGEWQAEVAEAGKRQGIAVCHTMSAPQSLPPDLWLMFSPIKKERTAFVVEKAVELGVARIMPVTMRRTQSDRWRLDKEQAHAVEAAEQCGATFVPEVTEIQPLERVLKGWDKTRALYWADETFAQSSSTPSAVTAGPAAILIGPEGGFTDEEKQRLRALPFVRAISLGPRILRAETAAIAAVVMWQTAVGDWR